MFQKQIIYSAFLIVIGAFNFQAYGKESLMKPWFDSKDCQELTINKFKSISDQKVIASVTIKDRGAIAKLMERIESLNPNGDEMIKFGPTAESMKLIFQCGTKVQTIEVYQQKFKTPSTGFNSDKSEVEKKLYQDIVALLKL